MRLQAIQATSTLPALMIRLRYISRPAVIFPSVISSVVLWLVTIVIAISCTALIFQGALAPYIGYGIAIAVVSAIVINLVVAFCSSDPATVGTPQSAPVLIQASVG